MQNEWLQWIPAIKEELDWAQANEEALKRAELSLDESALPAREMRDDSDDVIAGGEFTEEVVDATGQRPCTVAGPLLRSGHAAGCLYALSRTFLDVRMHADIGRDIGLVALECRRLHRLIWAVQHIPRALQVAGAETHDYAVKECWRVKEELAAYDAAWGPSSAHGRAVHAAQGFAPMSLLDVYIKGRSQLRTPVGAAFVAPSCSANVHSLSPRACLAVLDEAIKVAAFGFFHGYAPEPRGLRPQACAQVHCVMDAVHNIPTALVEPANTWWTAHRLREVFAAYDRAWGPGSAFAQQYSEHFIRPVSLLQTYDEADRAATRMSSVATSEVM